MKIAEFSVKNSLLVNLISVVIIFAGIVSLSKMQREVFPEVDYDRVNVQTIYPNASAEDIEKLITIPLEKEIKGVSGLKDFISTSEEGLSTISINIDPKVSDKEKVVDDIKNAVDRVSDLPDAAEDPIVNELKTSEIPIISVFLGGNDFDEKELRQYAENLEDNILDLPGVASVYRLGWRDHEFWVEMDPKKLDYYHMSYRDVVNALSTRNVNVPGGIIRTADYEYNVRTTAEFFKADEIENVVIRANDQGNWVKVSDVAAVKDAFAEPTTINRIDGKEAYGLIVIKSEGRDAIEVVAQVNKVLDDFRERVPEGITMKIADDMSYYVERRLNILSNNGIVGFVLVLIILFLFLDKIPALMTAIGIPIALFITFIVMNMMGITINLISMFGLIIVLGMIVDDGIIVAENVYRYIEEGMHPRQAAIKGTSEVIVPVTTTILTTWAAFLPLLMMTDLVGKFVKAIPIVVIIALAASLFEAFVILPSHIADFARQRKEKHIKKDKNHWFKKMQQWYKSVLNSALNVRGWFLLAMGVFLIFTLFWLLPNHIKVVMFSSDGIEEFHIRAEAKKGTSLTKLSEMMRPVESMVSSISSEELDTFNTFVGGINEAGGGFDPNAKNGSHLAQIRVYLTPAQEREFTAQQIVDRLRPELEKIDGFEKLYFYLPKNGPPTGNPVEVGIKGEKFDRIVSIAEEVKQELEGIDGVFDIVLSYEYGKKQLQVNIDEEKARQYYLTIEDIALAVRSAFGGILATTIKPEKADDEIDVLVRYPEAIRHDKDAFDQIMIENRQGNLVPLSAVATINESDGVYAMRHLDGKRVVYVTAEVDNKNATSLEVNNQLKDKFKDFNEEYPGYSINFGGEDQENQESLNNLKISAGFAMLLIFIILAGMFQSLAQPLVVISAIPFGLIGVVWAFFLHGRPLSFLAFIGVAGLIGIVVNDSIVLVDFINKLRKKGVERRESILQAGTLRLRPVLMTSFTTVGGLVSVAYGIGGSDPFLKPMALAIMWGLLSATFLILVAIPCIYAIVDDIVELFGGYHPENRELLEEPDDVKDQNKPDFVT